MRCCGGTGSGETKQFHSSGYFRVTNAGHTTLIDENIFLSTKMKRSAMSSGNLQS
jgi:hypothetical protein